MAQIEGRPAVQLHVSIRLDEAEARAIDGMVGYGDDAFLKAFYEGLGKAYLEKHEAGLRSFFESMRQQLPHLLSKADRAREAFAK
jgi:hypothetical protein